MSGGNDAAAGSGGSGGGGGGTSSDAADDADNDKPLYELYPINAFMELTLAGSGPDKETTSGIVVCTDDISNTIVLKKSLAHTALASDVSMISAAAVASRRIIKKAAAKRGGKIKSVWDEGEEEGDVHGNEDGGTITVTDKNNGDAPTISAADMEEMARPLPPPPTKRALEEREKRALKLAEENLRHINAEASPGGQATFDRLLKACNEVVWAPGPDGDSIVVLGQVRVDAPYGPDDCRLVRVGKTEKERGLAQGSLERVKKIVAHEG